MISRTLFVFLLLFSVVPCEAAQAKETQPSLIKFQISTKSGSKTFEVELADTQEKRTLGLMHRKFLSKDKGMLFIFEDDSIRYFWMKNTQLPLDLVFLDKDKKVVGVIKNMIPFSTETRSIDKPSRYVLEINAGLIESSKIAIGDTVFFKTPNGK